MSLNWFGASGGECAPPEGDRAEGSEVDRSVGTDVAGAARPADIAGKGTYVEFAAVAETARGIGVALGGDGGRVQVDVLERFHDDHAAVAAGRLVESA